MALIDESYTRYYSDDEYISTNGVEDIWDESYIHPDINTGYARIKICGCVNKRKVNENEHNSQQKVWEKFYINYLMLL